MRWFNHDAPPTPSCPLAHAPEAPHVPDPSASDVMRYRRPITPRAMRDASARLHAARVHAAGAAPCRRELHRMASCALLLAWATACGARTAPWLDGPDATTRETPLPPVFDCIWTFGAGIPIAAIVSPDAPLAAIHGVRDEALVHGVEAASGRRVGAVVNLEITPRWLRPAPTGPVHARAWLHGHREGWATLTADCRLVDHGEADASGREREHRLAEHAACRPTRSAASAVEATVHGADGRIRIVRWTAAEGPVEAASVAAPLAVRTAAVASRAGRVVVVWVDAGGRAFARDERPEGPIMVSVGEAVRDVAVRLDGEGSGVLLATATADATHLHYWVRDAPAPLALGAMPSLDDLDALVLSDTEVLAAGPRGELYTHPLGAIGPGSPRIHPPPDERALAGSCRLALRAGSVAGAMVCVLVDDRAGHELRLWPLVCNR